MIGRGLMVFYVFLMAASSAWAAEANGPFVKVSDGAQKARDDKRVQILNGELADEQAKLGQAQAAEVEAANRKAGPDELEALHERVGRHARNVEAINREINLVSKKSTSAVVVKAVVKEAPGGEVKASDDVPYWDTFRRKQLTPDRRD